MSGSNPTAIYNAYNCSQGLINPSICHYTIPSLRNAGSTYKPHFRNSLSFPPRHKICYNCRHDDIIKPFLWTVYCLPIAFASPDEGKQWSTFLFQEVGAPQLSTIADYATWVVQVRDPDVINLCNGLCLLIAWTMMVYNKSWPSPFNAA
ncbi:hypothetical protein BDN71DRAFT_1431659 [Pleurotus eryngii]|uniref:Uncharacterized protein n=1 Tax=Pleurotus eryngii TaxID=5323 RepID=A0A9P5ZXN3_PLEER|nr:hypothetical protein BDN71DRAFT_1431659 [Pleurotus eryngii]